MKLSAIIDKGKRKSYNMFASNTVTCFKLVLEAATSKILAMVTVAFKLLVMVTVALALLTPSCVPVQASSFTELKDLQNTANAEPGLRSVPAKTLPIPGDVSPAARALIAEPYWLPFWSSPPTSDNAWRALVESSKKDISRDLAKLRDALGVTMEQTTVGGINCYVFTPKTMLDGHRSQLIINAHGGAYVFGLGESGTYEATLMAAYGGYKVIEFDYRMPPDAPYPAGLDDAMAVWKAALAMHDPHRMAVVGTSAGGGLTLAMMLRAKQEGLPLPAAIAPYSPWADLSETGDSYKTNEGVDNVLVSYRGYLESAALLYAGEHDLKDPLLSPVYGDFHGFPPTILTTGTRDLFLSNTVRTHRNLRRAGVRAELQVFEGFSHAQYLYDPMAPETKEMFAEITAFFDEHLAR